MRFESCVKGRQELSVYRETAAQENASSYFPLLDRIAEGYFADFTTERDLYEEFLKVLQQDGHISSPEVLSTFQLALSLHAAAPRIEAQFQYYNTSVEPLLPAAQDAACPVWVHFDGKQYCSPTLERAQQDYDGPSNAHDLPFDRAISLHPELPVSTLYADIDSPLFGQFHQTLSENARSGRASYRIRYRPPVSGTRKSLAVSGYGVELALKRTDYIVIDDRDALENQEDKASSAENVSLEADEVADLKPLSASELRALGLKTSSFVLDSEDSFDMLIKISQDFPKYSSAISKANTSASFYTEHTANRNVFLPAGYNVVWLNGLQVSPRDMDAFTLLEKLRHERRLIGNFKAAGLTPSEAVSLISHSAITESAAAGEVQRYDYRDEIEGGRIIMWLNNIEKDSRYAEWPAHASAVCFCKCSDPMCSYTKKHSFSSASTLGRSRQSDEIYTT